ncbi:FecR family protein [Sphingomonas koreensis]
MTMRETETNGLTPLTHEALGWVVRLTSGSATQADARAFESWRAQGPAHAEAFREAAAFRKALRAMPLPHAAGLPGNVIPFGARLRHAAMDRRGFLVTGGAIAASGAMLMVNPPYALWPSLAELGAGERTGVGERRLLRPMAGVTVEMNGRTALSLDAARRRATLIVGEAFVAVAPDAAPFSIRVGDTDWLGKAAQFDVRASEREACVTCISGHLFGEQGAARHRIAAGQRFAAAPGEPARITAVDPAVSGSWRRGVLIFRDTPLVAAIEDINRYRQGRIILSSDAVGRRRVSGMFHTAQIENAVSQIQQLLDLRVTDFAGGITVMG